MPFVTIECRIPGITMKPAAVSLRAVMRGAVAVSKPSLIVSIRLTMSIKLDWEGKDPLALAIGTGADAGLIHITRLGKSEAAKGVARVRTLSRGGYSFNFGFIEQFGLVPQDKRATDARIINRNTIEVVMPDWAKPFDPVTDADPGSRAHTLPVSLDPKRQKGWKPNQHDAHGRGSIDGEEDDQGDVPQEEPPLVRVRPEALAARQAAGKLPKLFTGPLGTYEADLPRPVVHSEPPEGEKALLMWPAPGGGMHVEAVDIPDDDGAAPEIDADLRPPPAERVEKNGIVVVFEQDNEHVTHAAMLVEVTARQARFMAAMVAEMPNDVSKGALVRRMWNGKPPSRADVVVDRVYADLVTPLAEIGLKLDRRSSRSFVLQKENADASPQA